MYYNCQMLLIIFFIFFLVIFFVSLILFSFKRFSPVPYFPSSEKDMKLIIKSLGLQNNQTIIDLGAGDGIVIFEAAKESMRKKLNTKFIAVDINPILILVLLIRRFLHPNKENIKIVQGDFFKMNFFHLTPKPYTLITVYLYISPWFLDKVAKRILNEFPKARIVSYMYPVKSLKKKEAIVKGRNSIFVYS